MSTIKKLLWYFLLYISSTLFVYSVFHGGMFFYNHQNLSELTMDSIGYNGILPFVYGMLLLLLIGFIQVKTIAPEGEQETNIYAVFNLLFSLLEIVLGIITLCIPNNVMPTQISGSVLLVFGVGELAYSIYLLINNKIKSKVSINQ